LYTATCSAEAVVDDDWSRRSKKSAIHMHPEVKDNSFSLDEPIFLEDLEVINPLSNIT